MSWEHTSGSLLPIDDLQGDDAWHGDVSPFIAYLWGVLIVIAVVLTLREWATRRARASGVGPDGVWPYVVMGILWPLFIAALLFVVLWTMLTRRSR